MAFRLLRINHYNSILAPVNLSMAVSQHAGRFLALLAQDRNVIYLDLAPGAMLNFLDPKPMVARRRLRRRDRQIVIAYIFILARQKAGVTSRTLLHIHGNSISGHQLSLPLSFPFSDFA
jgi:hypothetical protein